METEKEEKNNPEEDKPRKNSYEDNYILIESDEENEDIQSDTIANQNINGLNNKELPNSELQENQKQNGNNNNNKVNGVNNTDKNKINEKDKFIDTEVEDAKNIERKLYYLRYRKKIILLKENIFE